MSLRDRTEMSRLVRATADGKTETVRLYWGLLGAVDEAGDSMRAPSISKSLWPLKVGNRTQQTVNAIGRDGKPYSSDVTLTVAAHEKVTVPAGTFDVFRVEEAKAGGSQKRTHWWAPSLGTSVKESFPDWTDFAPSSRSMKLTAVEPAAQWLAQARTCSLRRMAFPTGFEPVSPP